MILLDTHVWVWHIDENPRLSETHRQLLAENEPHGLGVSAISCWEVAKLIEYRRLELDIPPETWMRSALASPGVQLIELTPQISIASTKLPGTFHNDPADQIIVATARTYSLKLLTEDRKIRDYKYVQTS